MEPMTKSEPLSRCEKITLAFEKSKFNRLPMKSRIEISVHSSICPKCRKYFKDSDYLDGVLKKFKRPINQVKFSIEEKNKLKALLQKKK